MSDSTIHANALGIVESALRNQQLNIANVTGLTVQTVDDEVTLGNNLLSPGKYCFVDVRVIVPISQ